MAPKEQKSKEAKAIAAANSSKGKKKVCARASSVQQCAEKALKVTR